MTVFFIYLFVMGIVSVLYTVYDKIASKKGASRVPERTLLLMGLLGGALFMYGTMKLIRHKTKHAKFMILLPLEAILHIILLLLFFCFC